VLGVEAQPAPAQPPPAAAQVPAPFGARHGAPRPAAGPAAGPPAAGGAWEAEPAPPHPALRGGAPVLALAVPQQRDLLADVLRHPRVYAPADLPRVFLTQANFMSLPLDAPAGATVLVFRCPPDRPLRDVRAEWDAGRPARGAYIEAQRREGLRVRGTLQVGYLDAPEVAGPRIAIALLVLEDAAGAQAAAAQNWRR
jgi:hypothetical protein